MNLFESQIDMLILLQKNVHRMKNSIYNNRKEENEN